jgi:arginase
MSATPTPEDRPGTVALLGVPMDLGADRRGVDMGPSAIRYAGLADRLEGLGYDCTDEGDLTVPRPERHDPDRGDPSAKYVDEVETVCTRLADSVAAARESGRLPLVLGGDHSIAIGTARGVARAGPGTTGVLWIDAHADFNTPETSPSGNVHGMPLAATVGLGSFADREWTAAPGIAAENVALVGLRSVDDRESASVRESGAATYTMSDIDERGIAAVTREAIAVASAGVDRLYVSLDMDVLDPDEAPGVGTPVRGGMTYREAHTAMELVHSEAPDVCALELVEVNPVLDRENRTAELACELAASALGERVL